MRVLITGATGFVGGYLADEIARNNPSAEIWGTTHSSASGVTPAAGTSSALPAGVRLLSGDITDTEFVNDAVREAAPDQVYHLAGFASGAGTDRDKIFRVNVSATESLLGALRAAGRQCHVLLASSGYVYGPTQPGRPARETDAPAPIGAYAESKAAMESAAAPFGGADGPLRITAVRSFNHTGPRQTTEFVVPAFARQIARIEHGLVPPMVGVGNLEAFRDFLDVRDVVRAYRMLSDIWTDQAQADLRVVNVSSGQSITIRSILDQLIAQARVQVTVETDPNRMRPSDLADCTGDSRRLTEITGWQREIPLSQTVADTLEWWRSFVPIGDSPPR